MEVTLLYFDECPSWRIADEHLRQIMAADTSITMKYQAVDTPEEAIQFGFLGSPSFMVDGRDLFADPGAPIGLSCRVYQTTAGLAGSPTISELRSAITAAQR